MMLYIALLTLLPIIMATGCVRFFWDAEHRLQLTNNVGQARDVEGMLEHEYGCFLWYAADLENEQDRKLAHAVIKAYKASENIFATAVEILPCAYEICEQHAEYFHDIDVDEDGLYTSEFAQCGQCWNVYEMDDAEDDREPEMAMEEVVRAIFANFEEESQ